MATYNSLTSRDDAGALIPEDISRQIIQSLPAASVSLTSFRRVLMSRAQQRMPVLDALPIAYWVDGDTGLKQTSAVSWANKYLDARELAVLIPIPENVIADTDFPIWDEIKPRIAEAFGEKIDAAALFGTDSPSGWPGSIAEQAIAAGNEYTIGDSGGDLSVDISELMGLVENDGFDVSGFWARRRIRSRLRSLRDLNGQPIFQQAAIGTPVYGQPVFGQPLTVPGQSQLYGEPITFVRNGSWDNAEALITGDTSAAIIGIRQDISYRIFTEGVVSDGDGKVLLNLMQQDSVVMRATMRVAYQVANPITRDNQVEGTRFPFAVLHEAGS